MYIYDYERDARHPRPSYDKKGTGCRMGTLRTAARRTQWSFLVKTHIISHVCSIPLPKQINENTCVNWSKLNNLYHLIMFD
jgi:hypothetical protein